MKVLTKKSIITSTLLLGLGIFFTTSVAEANRSYLIDEFTIKYYKSLLEAKELSKPTEASIEYYTTRSGEEKFAGYKYGKLDDSFAYKNRTSRGIYRGAKGTKRSTAMTNYHTPSLADRSLTTFNPKSQDAALTEEPEELSLRASAIKQESISTKSPTTKKQAGLMNIMMRHTQIFKKKK